MGLIERGARALLENSLLSIMNTIAATNPSQTAFEDTCFREYNPLDLNSGRVREASPGTIQWSWACRKVKYLPTAENRRLRIYPEAQFVGGFGNPYAADAYEAELEGTPSESDP